MEIKGHALAQNCHTFRPVWHSFFRTFMHSHGIKIDGMCFGWTFLQIFSGTVHEITLWQRNSWNDLQSTFRTRLECNKGTLLTKSTFICRTSLSLSTHYNLPSYIPTSIISLSCSLTLPLLYLLHHSLCPSCSPSISLNPSHCLTCLSRSFSHSLSLGISLICDSSFTLSFDSAHPDQLPWEGHALDFTV